MTQTLQKLCFEGRMMAFCLDDAMIEGIVGGSQVTFTRKTGETAVIEINGRVEDITAYIAGDKSRTTVVVMTKEEVGRNAYFFDTDGEPTEYNGKRLVHYQN